MSDPTFPEFKSGDILFQTAGISSFSDAISSSTAQNNSLSFVHAAILYITDKGEKKVIEASPSAGVRIIPLQDFLDSSPKINGLPGVVVKRLSISFPLERAITNAISYTGQPYDWYYLPDNGRMYCTELIYESYIQEDGTHIFQAKPMNFRASDGTMPDFWIKLYEELNQPIPEGIQGTNPNDLSEEPNLIEIFRYFSLLR